MRRHKRTFNNREGWKDKQRKRQSVASKFQSKPYLTEKSYSPYTETEHAEAESIPKQSPKAALTSCHPSSCCPAALTSQWDLQPCLCPCPWTWHPQQLWLFWPFCFRWRWSSLSSPSPSWIRLTSSHPASTSPVNRDS